ncbi:MAG TPA: LPD38 domain-containing protein [Candidatus Paceibacterota bacterium]
MVDAFAQSPHIKGTEHGRVIDTSLEVPKEFVERVAKSDYAANMVNALNNVTELASGTLRRKIGQVAITTSENVQIAAENYFFGGIGIGKNYLGVNIDVAAFEDMARQEGITATNLREISPGKEVQGKNAILINPYSIFKEVQIAMAEEPYKGLDGPLADHTVGTIIHEVLHNLERGHSEDFAGILTRALGAMRTEAGTMHKILSEMWYEVINGEDFVKDVVDYEQIKADKNAFSNFSGHLSNIEGGPLGESVTGGEPVRGQGGAEGGKGPGAGRPEDVSRGGGDGQGTRSAATEVERAADAGSLTNRLGPELTAVVRGLKDELYKAKPEDRPAILARIKDVINGLDRQDGRVTPGGEGKPAEMGGQGGVVEGGAPSVAGGTNAQTEAPRAPEVAPSSAPRTKADVQRDIDKLNDEFDKGGLSDQDFNARMEQLVKEKKTAPAPATPKAVSPLEQVKQSGRYKYLTRAQIDEQMVKGATTEQLRAQQARINFDLQMESDDVVRQSLKHEKQVVQGELRWRKPVETLTTESLNTHARELEAKWMQGDAVTRDAVTQRLKIVDAELKKRRLPNPVDIIGDERGFLNLNMSSDPLEAKIDPNLPDYTKRNLSHLKIDMKGDQVHPGMLSFFGNLYAKNIRGTYAAEVFDRRMGLIKGSAMKQAGAWAEMLSGAAGRAMRMLNDGPFRWAPDGNIIQSGVRGVREILAPFKGRLNELRAFEIARYTIDLFQRNKQTGVELIDSIREVNNAAPEIRAAADELVAYRRGVLQYLTDAGMFSEEARQALIKLTNAYVPLYRWLEGKDADAGVDIVGPKTGKGPTTAGPANQVKRLIGGVRKIVDPFRSTVDQTRRFVRAADLNMIGVVMVEAAESNPELAKGMIWKEVRVKATADPTIAVQAENLLRRAKAHDIPISKETALELAEGLNEKRLSTRSDKLHVWRNGKMEVWNIAPELADMYKGFQPYEMHWMVRALGFVPQIAKIGITDNPAFAFINSFRDSFDAFAQSRYGFRLGEDSMRGFFESVTNGEYHKEFRASAGTAGGISSKSVTSLDEAVLSVLPKTPGDIGMHLIKHPVDALREFSLPFEEAARMGEFIRARKAGASVFEAGIAASRVTTNFRQHGLSMQGINHIVMFLNPALQSLDTFGRAVKRNPQRVIATGIASVMLPSIYLWAANRDDKDIQELRKSRYGSSNWFIRMPNGEISRYPKPFIFGAVFGTGVENALDAAYDKDPTAGRRFINALVDQIPYNLIPTTLNLTLGLANNKDFSTGGPIAPDQLETGTSVVEPRYRARPETGPTARKVGDLLNISPAKIEFAVRNMLGTLGFDALRGIDMVNDARERYPARTDAETPIVGRFLARYPTQGAFNLRKFYTDARKVEEAGNTLNLLEKQGDTDKAKAYVHEHIHEIAMVEAYADMRSELADIRGAIQAITDAPPGLMKPKDKREKIDFLMGKMIELSRTFNETMAKVKIPEPQ